MKSVGRRITSIDFFRSIAIFSVILVHTKPFMRDLFPDSSYRLTEYLFNQPPRFAVPFFFMAAGYFMARKYDDAPDRMTGLGRYVQRLLFLLLAWSIVYTLIPSEWQTLATEPYLPGLSSKANSLLASPILLLFEGAKVHLWFLPSLSLGATLLGLLAGSGRTMPLCLIAALLFVIGLLGGSYSVTPLGLDLPFTTRDGPFLSTICLAIGFLLYRRGPAPLSQAQALLLLSVGLGLHVLESWVLWHYYAVPMLRHNYLIGTVIGATGLLLFALAAPDFGQRSNLHSLGRDTLGIYLSHYLFVDALTPLTHLFELHIWQFVFPLLVFLLALALSRTLGRWRWTKPLVS